MRVLRYFFGRFLKPTIEPNIPPTMAALVSVSPPFDSTILISFRQSTYPSSVCSLLETLLAIAFNDSNPREIAILAHPMFFLASTGLSLSFPHPIRLSSNSFMKYPQISFISWLVFLRMSVLSSFAQMQPTSTSTGLGCSNFTQSCINFFMSSLVRPSYLLIISFSCFLSLKIEKKKGMGVIRINEPLLWLSALVICILLWISPKAYLVYYRDNFLQFRYSSNIFAFSNYLRITSSPFLQVIPISNGLDSYQLRYALAMLRVKLASSSLKSPPNLKWTSQSSK